MSAAMQAADKFWRDEPGRRRGALGDAAITKLQAWQGLQGQFNAAEIAERLNASDDPNDAQGAQGGQGIGRGRRSKS
jgi:hypothetical protein